MELNSATELKDKAHWIREQTVKMCCGAGMGHIAPAFSCTEILTALWYGGLMNTRPNEPMWVNRDYFVLSKGQACAPMYAILADLGFIDKSLLDKYCQDFSPLGGHAESDVPGIEAFTGSLGMGVTQAVGAALGFKITGRENHVYCLLGDGETQEGSVWEAIDLACVNQLSNITFIIDWNKQQATDKTAQTTAIDGDFAKALAARGCGVIIADGHNITNLISLLKKIKGLQKERQVPGVILASTIKGKGVKEIEGVCVWHYRVPVTDEEKRWFEEFL